MRNNYKGLNVPVVVPDVEAPWSIVLATYGHKTVMNGIPGKNILPFWSYSYAETLNPAQEPRVALIWLNH